MTDLVARLLAVHDGLAEGGIPHAFGGAIALAYCTGEPRGTRDLDVNVFVPPTNAARVFATLPSGVRTGPADVTAVTADGQVRLWWDDTPVDLFFDQHALHRWAASEVRSVPFAGRHIPVLACTALAVFKALFDRTKDWADLEEMLSAGTLERAATLGWLVQLVGPDDPRVRRLLDLQPPR